MSAPLRMGPVPACGQINHARMAGELLLEGVVVDRELPDDLLVDLHVAAELLVAAPQPGELLLVVADGATASRVPLAGGRLLGGSIEQLVDQRPVVPVERGAADPHAVGQRRGGRPAATSGGLEQFGCGGAHLRLGRQRMAHAPLPVVSRNRAMSSRCWWSRWRR